MRAIPCCCTTILVPIQHGNIRMKSARHLCECRPMPKQAQLHLKPAEVTSTSSVFRNAVNQARDKQRTDHHHPYSAASDPRSATCWTCRVIFSVVSPFLLAADSLYLCLLTKLNKCKRQKPAVLQSVAKITADGNRAAADKCNGKQVGI